ncbi:MAG: N-6 DNA methylase [Candidatus Marinimicrobia bacterium]|nr:N-6 DNA methylase [Candidatus Neomarinimicrobiota bacterium]
MSLFQKSVINKYIKNLSESIIGISFQKFKQFYGNSQRIENIRLLKEENYQEGFLREMFVQVLGYKINPDENYNLTTEFKNLTDARKADGAILRNGNAIGVIELKSTKTTDLESITEQAFSYKNHQPSCCYIITSNFERIRFYIDNATDFEEFNLFKLNEENFKILYLILSKESIFFDIPLKLKNESVLHEENISKQLYQDYSQFKRKIFNNLVKNNPQYDKLILFKKSQKLLDRLLFILFAEDTGLIPPNAISTIIEHWQKLKELEAYQPLYSRFKLFFKHLDKGHKYKNYELPPYNGGLFAADDILNNIKIDDEILKDDSLKLSSYDFNTDVDVNILGHIFEHSLNEIEEITAEIQGEPIIKKQTKRKKEGIFYTPKYITQYIVENTIGTLCKDKKEELCVNDIDIDDTCFYKSKSAGSVFHLSKKGEEIVKKLEEYKEWLLSLKILDPACGSGAFLIQALNFLIAEHKSIWDIETELSAGQLSLFDIDKAVLENNLYGVDINEESVEIARLSLWLRTAKKGRQLSDLNSNIKCGNSLIDDPEVAGDKAFDWNKEFPEIMQNGGFDVVIGNPPYFSLSTLNKIIQNYFKQVYINSESSSDIYSVFYEKGIELLKKNGLLAFITSNQWLQAQYGKTLRNYFIAKSNPIKLINFAGFKIFKDATVDTNIFITEKKSCKFSLKACQFSKNFKEKEDIENYINKNSVIIDKLKLDRWFIIDDKTSILRDKVKADHDVLKNHNINIFRGILTGFNKAFIIDNETKDKLCKNNPRNKDIIKPVLRGRDIHRYQIEWANLWLVTTLPSMNINIEDYPEIKEYLESFGKRLEQSGEQGCRKKTNNKWFETQDTISYYEKIYKNKIIYPETTVRRSEFYCDNNGFYIDKTAFMIVGDYLGYYQSILASKLMVWYLEFDLRSLGKNSIQYSKIFIENIPIPILSDIENQPFIAKADQMLELNRQLQEEKNKFLRRIKSNFEIKKISKKLELFYDYDFKTFISELNKQKIQLSLVQQDEWEEYFESYKAEINNLQTQISQTDKEIDRMVYELYGLTEDEIKIVESGF